MNRHLGCFHHLAIVNNAVVNIGLWISLGVSSFNSFEWIPKRRIAGLHSNSIFNYLKSHHTIFTTPAPFYVPFSRTQRFRFLHILAWEFWMSLRPTRQREEIEREHQWVMSELNQVSKLLLLRSEETSWNRSSLMEWSCFIYLCIPRTEPG